MALGNLISEYVFSKNLPDGQVNFLGTDLNGVANLSAPTASSFLSGRGRGGLEQMCTFNGSSPGPTAPNANYFSVASGSHTFFVYGAMGINTIFQKQGEFQVSRGAGAAATCRIWVGNTAFTQNSAGSVFASNTHTACMVAIDRDNNETKFRFINTQGTNNTVTITGVVDVSSNSFLLSNSDTKFELVQIYEGVGTEDDFLNFRNNNIPTAKLLPKYNFYVDFTQPFNQTLTGSGTQDVPYNSLLNLPYGSGDTIKIKGISFNGSSAQKTFEWPAFWEPYNSVAGFSTFANANLMVTGWQAQVSGEYTLDLNQVFRNQEAFKSAAAHNVSGVVYKLPPRINIDNLNKNTLNPIENPENYGLHWFVRQAEGADFNAKLNNLRQASVSTWAYDGIDTIYLKPASGKDINDFYPSVSDRSQPLIVFPQFSQISGFVGYGNIQDSRIFEFRQDCTALACQAFYPGFSSADAFVPTMPGANDSGNLNFYGEKLSVIGQAGDAGVVLFAGASNAANVSGVVKDMEFHRIPWYYDDGEIWLESRSNGAFASHNSNNNDINPILFENCKYFNYNTADNGTITFSDLNTGLNYNGDYEDRDQYAIKVKDSIVQDGANASLSSANIERTFWNLGFHGDNSTNSEDSYIVYNDLLVESNILGVRQADTEPSILFKSDRAEGNGNGFLGLVNNLIYIPSDYDGDSLAIFGFGATCTGIIDGTVIVCNKPDLTLKMFVGSAIENQTPTGVHLAGLNDSPMSMWVYHAGGQENIDWSSPRNLAASGLDDFKTSYPDAVIYTDNPGYPVLTSGQMFDKNNFNPFNFNSYRTTALYNSDRKLLRVTGPSGIDNTTYGKVFGPFQSVINNLYIDKARTKATIFLDQIPNKLGGSSGPNFGGSLLESAKGDITTINPLGNTPSGYYRQVSFQSDGDVALNDGKIIPSVRVEETQIQQYNFVATSGKYLNVSSSGVSYKIKSSSGDLSVNSLNNIFYKLGTDKKTTL